MTRMRTLTLFAIILLAAAMLALPSSASQGSTDEWPTFHHDWARSGYTTSEVPDDLQLLWLFDSGEDIASSPAVSDGRVFFVSGSHVVGSKNGVIYALDAEDGSFIWSYETGNRLLSDAPSPTIVNGTTYVGSWDNNLYALNAKNGELLWKFDVTIHSPSLTGWGAISGAPAVIGGRVYFGSWNGLFFALNAENGGLLWKFDAKAHIVVAPAVMGDKIYFATAAGTHEYQDNAFVDTMGWIYALNAENGSLIWKRHLEDFGPGGEICSSPTISNGKLFLGVGPMRDDNNLYALDAENGELIWIFSADRTVYVSPAVAHDKIYFGSGGGYVYALDENGSLVWKFKTGGGIYSPPAIGSGEIFIGSGARLYRLDAETGKLLQFYDIPSGVSGPPVIAYGKIYIGSDDGKLYCFGSPPAQPSSIIPQLVLGALAGAILLSVVLSLRFGPKRRR